MEIPGMFLEYFSASAALPELLWGSCAPLVNTEIILPFMRNRRHANSCSRSLHPILHLRSFMLQNFAAFCPMLQCQRV